MGGNARDAIIAESRQARNEAVPAAARAVRLQAMADTDHARSWAQHAAATALTFHVGMTACEAPQAVSDRARTAWVHSPRAIC